MLLVTRRVYGVDKESFKGSGDENTSASVKTISPSVYG